MYFIKKGIFFIFIINIYGRLEAIDLPPGASGTVFFDYFSEYIPPNSKGIYHILEPDNSIKYIGSSCDIYKRLSFHCKRGLLKPGDIVWAVIFNNNVRQITILEYERSLIRNFTPRFNKHTGAPGRSWRSEEMVKLQMFYDHNFALLHPQGQMTIRNLLLGKKSTTDIKMRKTLLALMRFFL